MPNNNPKTFETTVNIDVQSVVEQGRLINLFERTCSVFSDLTVERGCFEINFLDLGAEGFFINLSIISSKKMRELNNQYRQKDKVTDVLSFPVHDNLREVQPEDIVQGAPCLLGDIFICEDVALKQAKENGIEIETEFVELFIHGVLHLLGYDHEISKNEADKMYQLEEKIFDLFKEKE